jgi:uncharacterized membrane protein
MQVGGFGGTCSSHETMPVARTAHKRGILAKPGSMRYNARMSKKSGRKILPVKPAPAAEPPPEVPAGGGARLGLLRLAQLQFALAFAVSCYLAYTAFSSGSVAGCGAGSDCGAVLTSRWAYWFNLPVSAPAAAFYVVLLVTSVFAGPSRSARVQSRAWTILVAGAFAVLGAALWFIGLQAAIIGSWCPYCVAAHVLGGAGALLVLLAAPFVIRGGSGGPMLFGVSQRAMPAVFGVLALVPLVFGQYLSKPPAAAVATLSPASTASANTTASRNAAATPAPAVAPAKPSRKYSLHDGKFVLELHEAPMIGRPDAPHIAVTLFDYTCAHCRTQHGLLKRVQASFGNDLAIVLVPMPLDASCNPLLSRTGPDHVNACAYARIGMAVWRARPEVMMEYENWFFEPAKPRPVAEVRAKAMELTGRADFDAVLADPWIENWLKLGRDLFKANWDRTGHNFLPMLNVGPVLSAGQIKSDAELYGLLEQHLGLKRPTPAAPTTSE